ncbi:hypothetical protein [Azospirillum sp.]|uniref:hypothetical protein n=1 Tax=Azospirillum sp. TaxID=34012 RepID=UPI002D495258|nr:hypothetical protein [Azospirillum sp.]HYF85019.1 hypothetical protein [Azospirillum sp.]
MATDSQVVVDLVPGTIQPLKLNVIATSRFGEGIPHKSQSFSIDASDSRDGQNLPASSVVIEFGQAARSVYVPASGWLGTGLLGSLVGVVVLAVLGFYGAMVIRRMYNGTIDLRYLISEPDGKASISRFQFLIFTFVVAGSLLAVTLTRGAFPVSIPQEVLWLLGISTLGYIGGKTVQVLGGAPDAVSGPAGGGMLPFVQGDPKSGVPTVPGHIGIAASSRTARPFRVTSGTKDWSRWTELSGFAGTVTFTLSHPQMKPGELDGELRYTGKDGPTTIALATVTTFTTDNLIGTVEVRFRSAATAAEVNGTITP